MKFDIRLYKHDYYGEGWEAMADHALEMSGLDRLIFEDCYPVGSYVCASAFNAQTLPKRQRIEYLSELLPHSNEDIAKLIECWDVIGATPAMIDIFIEWCQARDCQASLDYFSALALDLEDAEHDPTDHGKYIFWLASNDDEFHRKLLWKDRHDHLYSTQEDTFLNEDESFVESEPEPFEPAPPEFRYRKLPDEGSGKPFLTVKQIERLSRIFKLFKTKARLSLLLGIGKRLFETRRILYTDRWIWTEYANAKKRCTNDLPAEAKQLFDRIKTARSLKHLKYLSAYTFAHFNNKMFNDIEPISALYELHPNQKAWVWNYIKKRKREF